MDFVSLLNQLIPQLLPNLNKDLPTAIKNANLDPCPTVYSYTDTLEGVEVTYSITDMTGLSSTSITTITILTAETSLPTITGTMTVDANLSENLTAPFSGKISAKIGPFPEDVEISGEITATGLTATTKGADYTATFSEGTLTVTEMTLNSLSLGYTKLMVTVNGLGRFNWLSDPLIALITTTFEGLITGEISSRVQPVLNSEIASQLPFPKPDTADQINAA